MTTNQLPDNAFLGQRAGSSTFHACKPGRLGYSVLLCSGRSVQWVLPLDLSDVDADECKSCRKRFGDVKRAVQSAGSAK